MDSAELVWASFCTRANLVPLVNSLSLPSVYFGLSVTSLFPSPSYYNIFLKYHSLPFFWRLFFIELINMQSCYIYFRKLIAKEVTVGMKRVWYAFSLVMDVFSRLIKTHDKLQGTKLCRKTKQTSGDTCKLHICRNEIMFSRMCWEKMRIVLLRSLSDLSKFKYYWYLHLRYKTDLQTYLGSLIPGVVWRHVNNLPFRLHEIYS